LLPLPTKAESPPCKSFSHWIPAEQAIVGGRVQEELLDPAARTEVRSWLSAKSAETESSNLKATSGCDVLLVTSSGVETADPRQALKNANLAFLGIVKEVKTGLFRGRITSLVSVQVDQWIKAPFSAQPSTIYFLNDDAALTIGETTYCRRTLRKDRLAAGQRVFLATSNVVQKDPLLLLPYGNQLFFETANQRVSSVGPATSETPRQWSDLEETVRRWRGGAE
jgi:hypothetical protein